MKLNNPFPDSVRLIWLGWWRCLLCNGNGMNCGGLELHHITGRDSNSALNGAPLCKRCHEHMNHNQEEERTLFIKVIQILRAKAYKIIENDIEFMKNHPYLLINNKYLDNWLAK